MGVNVGSSLGPLGCGMNSSAHGMHAIIGLHAIFGLHAIISLHAIVSLHAIIVLKLMLKSFFARQAGR